MNVNQPPPIVFHCAIQLAGGIHESRHTQSTKSGSATSRGGADLNMPASSFVDSSPVPSSSPSWLRLRALPRSAPPPTRRHRRRRRRPLPSAHPPPRGRNNLTYAHSQEISAWSPSGVSRR